MSANDDDANYVADSLPIFISEARDHLKSFEKVLLEVEQAPDPRELFDGLFRAVHIIKGAAGIFGIDLVVEFSHHVETVIDRLRLGRQAYSRELGTLLFQCNDWMKQLVLATADDTLADCLDNSVTLIEALKRFQAASAPAPVQPLAKEGTVGEVVASRSSPSEGARSSSTEDSRYLRVRADRLDHVINLLGELVIASAGASQLAEATRQSPLVAANQQIATLVEEIRNGTLQLRMVAIGDTFSRFRRLVRDTATALGKNIALDVVGADTELDKSMVEQIVDPLTHLVRNALDHGLETPLERTATGKPAQGSLQLLAAHEASGILIRISDDGRGINRQKVLNRAWERGIVEKGRVPSDQEILELIFEPGLSTAEKVTNLSGRGVGMDVVRSNIEALRGSLTVSSIEGKGSTIEIRLPLTLAIVDGFLVSVGTSKFVLPLESIEEVIDGTLIQPSKTSSGLGIVVLRDRWLSVLDLRTIFELDGQRSNQGSIVVVKGPQGNFGVSVDVLWGQHRTVIKPLARILRRLKGISGSTILGTGDVAMILDVAGLATLAMRDSPKKNPADAPMALAESA